MFLRCTMKSIIEKKWAWIITYDMHCSEIVNVTVPAGQTEIKCT